MSRQAEQFLERARALIDRGDHASALSLLVVAMDNAPGDSAVVSAAEELRQRIARAQEMQAGLAKRASAARRPGMPSRSQNRRPMSTPSAIEAFEDMGLAPDPAPNTSAEPVTEQAPGRRRSPLFVAVAWLVLVAAMSVVLAVLVFPGKVETFVAYRQFEDPYSAAVRLQAAGDFAGASDQLDLLIRRGDRASHALLLLAEIHRAQGDSTEEVAALQRAASHPEASSDDVLAAARRLRELGDATSAVAAYQAAFTRGISPDHWLEIAAAFLEYGRTEAAISLYRTILRSQPEVADSAVRALTALGALD